MRTGDSDLFWTAEEEDVLKEKGKEDAPIKRKKNNNNKNMCIKSKPRRFGKEIKGEDFVLLCR